MSRERKGAGRAPEADGATPAKAPEQGRTDSPSPPDPEIAPKNDISRNGDKAPGAPIPHHEEPKSPPPESAPDSPPPASPEPDANIEEDDTASPEVNPDAPAETEDHPGEPPAATDDATTGDDATGHATTGDATTDDATTDDTATSDTATGDDTDGAGGRSGGEAEAGDDRPGETAAAEPHATGTGDTDPADGGSSDDRDATEADGGGTGGADDRAAGDDRPDQDGDAAGEAFGGGVAASESGRPSAAGIEERTAGTGAEETVVSAGGVPADGEGPGRAGGASEARAASGGVVSEEGSDGSGKRPGKTRSRKRRILRRVVFTVLGFIGFCVVGFAVAYLFTPVPSPQEKALAQGPIFYYADGETQIAKTGVNRTAVELERIPEHVRNAVIAAENETFYDDPGVSIQGTTRAVWSTVTGQQLQGGSTITQQMVRNYYADIGREVSVVRKLKEMMVALKVDQSKSKDWILEQYLNTIYFGRNAYGVQAAAKAYYGKDVSRLTAAEGAYLAAAIQQPSNFAKPTGENKAYIHQRWRSVLGNMVENGMLTQAEADALKFPDPVERHVTDILKGQKGYMVNLARKELIERRGYTEDEINRSGLKITTTFDKDLMDAAKKAVQSNTPEEMSKQIRTGLVSVDPATGQVVAFYGGRGYLEEALTSAFGSWAQAGSGFKPIALIAALDAGKTLASTYDGSSPQYFNGTPIENDSNKSFGTVTLAQATQNSINTAYVNLGQDIGTDTIAEMAERLGIPPDQMTEAQRNAATFPLGIVSLHPVQQAGVYASFAAEGMFRKPFVVKSVTDDEGHKRTFNEKGKRAYSVQDARDATYAMERVVRYGTGTNAQLPDGRDVAGKTGTTDKGRAIWFNGFIPQMATSVAMFHSDGKPLKIPGYGAYGGQLPAEIWRSYMSRAVDIADLEPKSFGAPSMRPGGGYGGSPRSGGDDDRGSSDAPSAPSDAPPTDGPQEPGVTLPPTGGTPTNPPGGGNGGGDGTGGGDGGDGGGDGGTGGGDGGGDPPGGGDGGGDGGTGGGDGGTGGEEPAGGTG